MPDTRIQMRRGTTAQWASANPVLAAGEQGLDTDTGIVKVGDGTTAWSALAAAAGATGADIEGRFGFYPRAGRIFATSSGQGTGAMTLVSQSVYWQPFVPSRTCTIDTIRAEVVAAQAGETFSLAIYSSLDGDPGTLIDSVTGLLATTPGIKTGTLGTPVPVTGQTLYFAAFLWVSGGLVPTFRGGSSLHNLGARLTDNPDNVVRNLTYWQSGQSTFPSTASLGVVNNSASRVAPFIHVSVGSVT